MTTKAASRDSYVNFAQSYAYNAPIPNKLAGRDFDILTLVSRTWFERWIFPKDFTQSLQNPSDTKTLHIGRMIRHLLFPGQKPSNLESEVIEERDPIINNLDGDYLYNVTRVFEEKAFFENFQSGKSCSTELIYHVETNKFSLQLCSGDALMKFEINKETFEGSPRNHLLDDMLPPAQSKNPKEPNYTPFMGMYNAASYL